MPNPSPHIALIVRDYDEAIAWFTEKRGFALVARPISPHAMENPANPRVVRAERRW